MFVHVMLWICYAPCTMTKCDQMSKPTSTNKHRSMTVMRTSYGSNFGQAGLDGSTSSLPTACSFRGTRTPRPRSCASSHLWIRINQYLVHVFDLCEKRGTSTIGIAKSKIRQGLAETNTARNATNPRSIVVLASYCGLECNALEPHAFFQEDEKNEMLENSSCGDLIFLPVTRQRTCPTCW
ncbi:hypothetical protein F5141DRAFT_1150993 [Pisolithus sp. B1]|nr:hypothetical protein F5141DRAFT_1150993 [Pisolithus sp. B1]